MVFEKYFYGLISFYWLTNIFFHPPTSFQVPRVMAYCWLGEPGFNIISSGLQIYACMVFAVLCTHQ